MRCESERHVTAIAFLTAAVQTSSADRNAGDALPDASVGVKISGRIVELILEKC